MIVRQWKASAQIERMSDYPKHFETRVLPILTGMDGFLGAELLARTTGVAIEFVVLSRWTSLESIQAFAGMNHDCAVVEQEAADTLLAFDRHVAHFEVIASVAR
jgi:heme-degrading monooxygenase HmoA